MILSITAGANAQATPPVESRPATLQMREIAKKYYNSLVRIECPIKVGAQKRTIVATGVYISDGIFMALGLDTTINPKNIIQDEFKVYTPGNKPKTYPAKLMGIDPMTGLTFIKVTSGRWSKVPLASKSRTGLGRRVYSLGLALTKPASPVALGFAYVSSIDNRVYKRIEVTGGTLGPVGSIVFNDKLQVIGIVGQQPMKLFRTLSNRGSQIPLRLKAEENTTSFIPVEEFIHIITKIPTGGTVNRMKWIGVGRFAPLSEEDAKAYGIKTPAAKIDQVIPSQPAAEAGLRNGDIVVGLNGKPLRKFINPGLVSKWLARQIIQAQTDTVKLTVRSANGSNREITISVAPMPKLPGEAQNVINGKIGFQAREKVMLDKYLTKGPDAKTPGMIVVGVGKGSPAQNANLLPGDLIISINGTRVSTAKQVKRLIDDLVENPEDMVMLVKRGKSGLKKITIPKRIFESGKKSKKPAK